EENYVDPVEPKHLIDGALKGMLKGLDPYSQYLDQKAYGALQDVTQGKFSGIGVVVGVRDNYPTVISPIEGSPAWEAGLRSCDATVRVEGRSTQGFNIEDVAGLVRGPEGSRARCREPRPETHWPMVVLVDEGSASAAEIVAGALQDLDRALLMGRTTFGKGSVQSVFPLRGREAALKLTTALYYTPSGRSIHRVRADSLEQADGDDSDDDSAPEHHPAPADSARQPAFHTRGGRIVYGGGGIRPDVVVA